MSLKWSSKEITPHSIKGMCNIMGTFVTIMVISSDTDHARNAIGLAFKEIFRINNLMSLYIKESEVSRLNRDGYYNNVSSDTLYVVKRANFFSELTDGAFDITLLPVLKIWESHARKNRFPNEREIKRNLNHVGYKYIDIDGTNIRFLKKDMSITLAGVAKGYAVDKAIETLAKNGIRHALVNGGGDIRVLGGKTNDLSWNIGILDPKDKKKLYTTMELKNQSIATSGSYQRSFNDIIDPKGGRPVQDIISATVITEKAIDADVLATASMIMGVKKGSDILNGFKDAEFLYITKNGRSIKRSPNILNKKVT